jgi:hypothetical protein
VPTPRESTSAAVSAASRNFVRVVICCCSSGSSFDLNATDACVELTSTASGRWCAMAPVSRVGGESG